MRPLALTLLAAMLAAPLACQDRTDEIRRAMEPADAASPAKPAAPSAQAHDTGPGENFIRRWERGAGEIDSPAGKFRLGGYASLHHKTIEKYNGGNSTNFFDSIRVVPQMDWEVTDWLEFAIEIEFEGGGAGAPYLTNNYIVLEYAEARATPLDELNFKAGILLVNWGRYNRNHDDILWDLADRPFATRLIVPGTFMQPGAGVYGSFNQVPFISFNYDIAVTQGLNSNFSSNDGSRNARTSFRVDNNDNKALWFHFGMMPDFGTDMVTADVGASFTYQQIAVGNRESLRGVGVDGGLKFKVVERFGIDVTGEFSRLWINRSSSPTVPNGLWGWFADVLFKFDPFPAAWREKVFGANPYIGLIFRLEQNDLNDDYKGAAANDDRFAVTIGLSFRPISKLVLRLEWKNTQARNRDDGDENTYVISTSIGF